jgi:hypothetical protein
MDVTYQIVEIQQEGLFAGTARLYIGPDKLVHRAEVVVKSGMMKGHSSEFSLHNIKTGQSLTATDFVFQTPKDAKPAEDTYAKLIPVGKDAPNFTLPAPQSGQIALDEALKGKKAVIVNFWFYH